MFLKSSSLFTRPLFLKRPHSPLLQHSAAGVRGAPDPDRQDLALLATALDGLLRRCPPRGVQRQFPSALKAHRALKVQFRLVARPWLPAQVLNDLSHEIAGHVDASVRAAALRCLRRRAAEDGRGGLAA
jgi:hypothetical protein